MSLLAFVNRDVVLGAIGLFLFWWSCWSLLDFYLIPRMSPWSELVVLVIGLLLLYVSNSEKNIDVEKLEDVSEKI